MEDGWILIYAFYSALVKVSWEKSGSHKYRTGKRSSINKQK
jgi:hypothetical protein